PCHRRWKRRWNATCSASIAARWRKAGARSRKPETAITYSCVAMRASSGAAIVVDRKRQGGELLRVLICDDHTLVRAGLRRLLESFAAIEVVAEAASADEAVIRARAELPDLGRRGRPRPGRRGFDAPAERRRTCPDGAVVMMPRHDDALRVREALARGAMGLVVKGAAPAELEIALRAAAAGRPYLG